MANFTPSNLVAAQALFSERFQAGEWRLPDSVALRSAIMGGIANPELAAIRTREDRTVYAYFPIRQAATNGTARAHAHTGARGDSAAATLSWSTFSEPFSVSIKQGDNNVMSLMEMYAAAQRNAALNLLARLDAAFVAALVADKTQVNAGGGNGTFNATDDVYEVPALEKDYFFQNAKATMEYNLFGGQIFGVIDDKAKILAQRLGAQGAANAINTVFQFAGMELFPTTRAVLGTGYLGSGVFFEAGLAAFIPWIPVQNRKALDPVGALSYNGDWGQITIPGIDIPFAVHSYAVRADNSSANNGQTQDLTINVELSIDMAYVSAPLSALRGSNDSVIYAVGQLS